MKTKINSKTFTDFLYKTKLSIEIGKYMLVNFITIHSKTENKYTC